MKHPTVTHYLSALAVCAATITSVSAQGLSVSTPEQISNARVEAFLDGNSSAASLSPNAELLAYESSATNIDIAGEDVNNARDIFLYRPTTSPTTSLESVDNSGAQTIGSPNSEIPPDSFEAAVSARLADAKQFGIAFSSSATNLLELTPPGNTPPNQIYLRLPSAKRTIHLSRNALGEAANGDCFSPAIAVIPGSTNKFKVVYTTYAGNLEAPPIDSRGVVGLFEATVSIAPDKKITVEHRKLYNANGVNYKNPVLSGDGTFLAFVSDDPNLIPGRVIAGEQIYRVPLAQVGITAPTLISQKDGEPGIGASDMPALSYTGKELLFTTTATNLGVTASASSPKYALYSDSASALTLVNQNAAGIPGNGVSGFQEPKLRGVLSADGRIAVFEDRATNLTTVPTSGQRLIFAKDLKNPSVPVQLVSKTADESEINAPAFFPAVGGKGFSSSLVFVAFNTAASNLGTPGQSEEFPQRVFRSTIDFPDPPIVANFPITAPPDATVVKQQVTLTFIKFGVAAGFSAGNKPYERSSGDFTSTANVKVSYVLTLRGVKTKTRIQKVTTRNKITIRKLKPDTYRASYRGVRSGGGTKRVATKPSPSRTFVIK
jgi:hypothetical protein